ncbi:ABC transporter ATP-binding protein [Paenibacillus sp. WST5]|uniref:ABC transporter ATP-binding protein n=1 Tax=Paenibacillus sedimenti TaxID=2770274 RepID=A0A926KYU4_9BACL|nr:ABC transporter ATP-binding protein [Paenibacillus sedimenti]
MKRRHWLINYIREIKGKFSGSVLLEAIAVVAELVMIAITKYVIDDIFIKGHYEKFFIYMEIFATAITTYILSHALAFILMRKNVLFFRYRLMEELLRAFFQMPQKDFQNQRIGQMTNYFTNEATMVADLLGNRMLMVSVNVLKCSILLLFIGFTDWTVLIIVLCCAYAYIRVGKYFSPRLKAIGKEAQEQQCPLCRSWRCIRFCKDIS